MPNVASLAAEATDVQIRGPRAVAEAGPGATFYYRGNRNVLTPDRCAEMFATMFINADNYRKVFLPEILEAFAQYNGETSQPGKEPWQSDFHVPLPAQSVDTAAGRIFNAIFGDNEWFDVDPTRKRDTIVTEFAQKGILWQIKKSEGTQEIKTSIKDGLICGLGPLKIHFEQKVEPFTESVWVPARPLPGEIFPSMGEWELHDSERVCRRMRFESLIPTDTWKDPTGKGRWFIQRTTRAVSDLWPLCHDLKDPDTGEVIRRAVYDPVQVAKVQPGMRDSQRVVDAARVRRDLPAPYGVSYDQTVDLYELWGDFIDPDTGVTLFRNIVATFAGEQGRICIRYPQRNPFRHGHPPFIIFESKLLPHQVYGYGILKQNAKIENAIIRHANVLGDKAMLQVPTLEYDASASKDPAIQGGSRPKFSPGKMWPRKPGPDKKIFYPVDGFKEITEFDLMWFDRLLNLYQMGSMVPEIATGQQLSNNRKTKGEMQLRAGAADQNFDDVAVHIEEQALSPMLQMIYLTMIQFEDEYDDDDLTRMFGDDQEMQAFVMSLKSMTDAERWNTLYLDTEFKAVGITNSITRQRKLGELNDFFRIMESDPLTSMFVNRGELLGEALPLYQLPTRMILPNAEAMIQMMQMGQIQGAFGGGQGGAPGPPGAAPGPGGPPGAPGPAPPGAGPPPPGPAAAPGGLAPMGNRAMQGRNPHNSLAALRGEAGRR